jgi:hypothetical protein
MSQFASQAFVELVILEAIQDHGPLTAGELSWKYLGGRINAARRDEAIESLLRRGAVKIASQRLPLRPSMSVRVFEFVAPGGRR